MIRRRLVIGILLAVLFALGWWSGRVASRDLYADLDRRLTALDGRLGTAAPAAGGGGAPASGGDREAYQAALERL